MINGLSGIFFFNKFGSLNLSQMVTIEQVKELTERTSALGRYL